MTKFLAFLSDPQHQIRWWAVCTVVWVVMTPITLATSLAHSLPYLNFLSLFANFASCGTALVAAWSYHRARNVDEKVDPEAHFARLEENTVRLEEVLERTERMERLHGDVLAQILDAVHFAEPRDAT